MWDWDEVGNLLEGFGGDVVGAISDVVTDAIKTFSGTTDMFSFDEQSLSTAKDAGGAIAEGAKAATEETASDAAKWIGMVTEESGMAAQDLPEAGKSMFSKFREWYGTLSKDEKELFKGVAGAGLSGLAGMASAKMKGDNDLALADRMSENRQAELDHKLAATATPRGVPFKAPQKPKQLTDRLGNPVGLPNNPMKPKGLIYGGMYG